jgi:hypothetical protein
VSATLGFHLLPGSDRAAVTRAATGMPVVKVCDADAIGPARAAGCPFVYYRPYLPDDGDCADGADWGTRVWRALQEAGDAQPEAICFRNECTASAETARQYLAFRATLRGCGYRGSVVLGSFGAGKPEWAGWTALLTGLAGAVPDAVDLHEYWSLSVGGSAPWWALRHQEALRRGVLPPDWPVLIGECGSDDVGEEDGRHRRGWNDGAKLTAAQELGNLLDYRSRCAPSVLACFVFADGNSDPKWEGFHTFGTPLEAGLRANAATPIAPSAPLAVTTATSAAGATAVAPSNDNAGPLAGEKMRSVPAVTIVDAIPELNQGQTRLCWAECVQEAFAGSGNSVSVYDLYKQVKGADYTPPGEGATFAELTACVRGAALLTGVRLRWFGLEGRVNDLATFDQLLRDGTWIVIVGANEQALVDDLALAEQAGYGHYFLCRHLDFDGDGRPDTDTVDSYRGYDHVPVRIPLAAVHDAMRRNWDANYDALAFQVG